MRITLLILITQFLFSQDIRLSNVNSENYPIITSKIVAINSDGDQIVDFENTPVIITENGQQLNIIDISCTGEVERQKVSAVLAIDVSQSMDGDGIMLAESAANQWVDLMLPDSETAITAFSDISYLLSDFTSNRNDLYDIIDDLFLVGGTNFDEAFLDDFAGALPVSENSANRPVVVFLTDGLADGNSNQIIQKAAEIGAVIFSVILFEEANEVIRSITESSGGVVFESVDNISQIRRIYQTIFNLSQTQVPCMISWETVGCQIERDVIATLGSASSTISYTSDIEDLARIVYPISQFVIFDDSKLGDQDKKEILIKAEIEDLLIDTIIIENPKFSLINFSEGDFPIELKKDSSIALRIQFDHTEDKFESTNIRIISNACRGDVFYATGGAAGGLPGANDINIIEPNGGELYATGADTLIKWEGSFPDENLLIEYSIDNGNNWVEVNGNIKNETIKVKYPGTETDNGRVRITQFSNDFGTEYLRTQTKSNIVNSVDWNPNGDELIISYNYGGVSIVDAFNGAITSSKTIHIGEANTARWAPDGIRYASGGDDGRLVITNKLNSFELFSFDASSEPLLKVDWSPDGKMLAAAGNDKNIYIFNPDNGQLLETLEAHNKKINKLKFSHDGSMLLSVSSDSLAKVWSVIDWERIDGLARLNAEVTCADWLENDAQIITTTNKSGQNELNIWDVFLGAPLGEIEHLEYLNAIEINDIDGLFATGGRSGKAHLYGLDDLVREINFDQTNSSEIVDISWSPTGEQFAVASAGNPDSLSLRFYSVKKYPIAINESNGNFSLKRSTARLRSVDFGQTNIGTTKEIIISDLINLTGPVDLRVDSLFIENDFSDVFSLRGDTKFDFKQSDKIDIIFDFTPKQIRDYSANIVIRTNLGERRGRIQGEGVSAKIENIDLDFGEIVVGNDDTKEFWIRNNSNEIINVDQINILGPNFINFNVLRPNDLDEPRTIDVNDSLQFIIEFEPDKIGKTNSIIQINYQESDVAAYLSVIGVGIKPELSVSSSSYYSMKCYDDEQFEFQLSNIGRGLLEIESISSDNNNINILNDAFGIMDNQTVSVSFTAPYSQNDQNINFEIESNDPDNPIITENITIDMLRNEFKISQSSITFFHEQENVNETKSVSVVNIGEAPIIWSSDFSVTLPPDNKISVSYTGPSSLDVNNSSSLNFIFAGSGFGDVGTNSFLLEDVCGNSQLIEIYWEVQSNSNLISIDFEQIDLVCDLDTTFNLRLGNLSNRDIQIDNIILSNTKFSSSDLNILPLEGADLEINFLTDEPGSYTSDLFIEYNNSQTYTKQITINLLERDYQFITNNGTIVLNTNGNDNAFVELLNSGDVDLNLPVGQDFGNVVLLSSDQNPVPPGGQAMLEFGNPTKEISEDLVVLDFNCFENYDTLLISSIAGNLPLLEISIPVITKNIGEKFNIPVDLQKFNFNEEIDNTIIDYKFIYNSTLMMPDDLTKEEISNGSATFNLGAFDFNQEFPLPEFTALWGNDSTTIVELFVDGFDYPINKQNGLLRIADLCFEGGVRLFNANGINVNITPNPVISNFNISFDELPDDITLIKLINLSNGIETDLYNYKVYLKELKIDLSGYANGVYLVEIKVGERSTTKKIILEN